MTNTRSSRGRHSLRRDNRQQLGHC
jgi:hypothetical protein